MADLIIKNGRLLPMNGQVIDRGSVVVDEGIITYAGKDTGEKADKVIDAKGCVVLPGLINAHTHLSMTLFRGFADDLPHKDWIKKLRSAESTLTPADVKAGAYLGILEMIRSGTTAFADMYIHMDGVASAVEETGLRAALGYGMIEGLNEEPETKLKKSADFVRRWNGAADGRITTMYAPHSAASCSRDFLVRVKELALKDGVGIHIHVLETEEELIFMKKRYGMCSVHLLDDLGILGPDLLAAHCIWLSDGDMDKLKSRNVNVVHCPTSNMNLGAGVSPVPQMLGKGINVALGTDGAASGGGLNMWKEMRTASCLHKLKDPRVLPASVLLEMATVNGARALDINTGMLRPGCPADIILVDMKRPQFVSSNVFSAPVQGACEVKTTIVGGRILMEDHRVLTLDEEKILDDAGEVMSNLRCAE